MPLYVMFDAHDRLLLAELSARLGLSPTQVLRHALDALDFVSGHEVYIKEGVQVVRARGF